ncbi:hypothetical protein DNL40_04900 [Xylanimonas oleitrophica]|uniref:PKD domain-containing protein n=1 Tax=Xylanimonas oleitrophica TaxID=2607479 RepID=A0A2W5WUW3_9MICO|nr:hypothetical protein DNL40_04900 [Xylanimonas oleitrophica]
MNLPARLVRRACAALGAAALLLGAALVGPAPAAADDALPPLPETVSADSLPTVQIDDGVVWKQVVVGGTVYVGGNFQNARPAGAAKGQNLVRRTHLLAYDLATGVLTSFAHTLNGDVTDMAASPDGRRLYVVGGFTSVDGQTRNRIAAFDLPSGALSTSFAPSMNGNTRAVAATDTTVYAGGYFSAVNGTRKYRLAAMNASNGSVVPGFTPVVDDNQVMSIVVAPDQRSVVASGSFTSVNGSSRPGYGLARLDAATGASLPLPVNDRIRNATDNASIMRLTSSGDSFYGVGWAWNRDGQVYGTTEGTFSARWSDGTLRWLEDCHGDTYDVAVGHGVVYTASHKHYCGNSGGFPQTDPWTYHKATAFTEDVRGVNTRDIYGYPSHEGTPRGEMLNWFPDTEWGSFTSSRQSTWSVTVTDGYVLYGGEFPSVNGQRQYGIARFATRAQAPNRVGPEGSGAALDPTVVSVVPGTVRVSFPTTWDRDDKTLTYRLYRDSDTGAPVHEKQVTKNFWDDVRESFVDTGVTPGATHRYRVAVSDPWGNVKRSGWVSVTVAAGTLSTYASTVRADGASSYWRLGEPAGTVAADWAGDRDLQLGDGVVRGTPGAVPGDADGATTFGGTPTATGGTTVRTPGPGTFTLEAWFRTTTTRGGKIVGFGSSPTGDSGSYDRHVYMTDGGQLVFGVYPGRVQTVSSSAAYNDGAWHHVAATLGPDGMQLFVDGTRVAQRGDVTGAEPFDGYWRVGGDNLGGWPSAPTSSRFAGVVDDVAVYPAVLTAAQVRSHLAAAGVTVDVPPRPTDVYGGLVYDADPALYWRYDEPAGDAVADSGTQGSPGRLDGAWSRGEPGALADGTGTAVRFSGPGNVYALGAVDDPQGFTLETWVRTTSTQGGKVIGLGDRQTGLSGSYDRHVYMQDDGRLVLGVWTGVSTKVTTARPYNDGAWHHVVASQGPEGLRLYVDGALEGSDPQTGNQQHSGYWRVGGDTTWGSTSPYLAGAFDETAVYGRVLSPQEVALHHEAGVTGKVPNVPPAVALGVTATKLDVVLDGSASHDPDGTLTAYEWDLGDGTTATGVTATHTYASPGTYTVTLTVTDDRGATATARQDVTVVANVAPVAAFVPAVTGLRVDVDATASHDPDGTIESYEWDLGDGTTATGATASRTYAAAGTYTVTLTVTDDDGATATARQDVTVEVPAVVAQDSFGRTVTSGWGTADVGGAWSTSGAASSFSVGSGTGRVQQGAGATRAAQLQSVSAADVELYGELAVDRIADGGGTYVSFTARTGGFSSEYRAKVWVRSTGAVQLQLVALQTSETTLAAANVAGLTLAPGERLAVRAQVEGSAPTALRAKVWKVGQAEPPGWQLTGTSAVALLQDAGGVGVVTTVSGSATTGTSTITVDDLRVGPLPRP